MIFQKNLDLWFFFHFLKEHKSKNFLIAVSGGPDSLLCLLLFITHGDILKSLQITIGVININHKKNAHSFFKEETYLENLCKNFKIEYFNFYLYNDYENYKGSINQEFFRNFRLKKIYYNSLSP
jgi:tRNA(Ile)-lysidine synthase TilS/MesJ